MEPSPSGVWLAGADGFRVGGASFDGRRCRPRRWLHARRLHPEL